MDMGIGFLVFAALGFMIDRAVLSTTPAPPARVMTDAQIEAWHDDLILEAISNNVSVSVVSGYDAEEDEAELSPEFEGWAAEQAKYIMATLNEKQRDVFVRTGNLPRGFNYTRVSPPCLLENEA